MQILCVDDLRVFQAVQPDGVDRAGRAVYARSGADGLNRIRALHGQYEILGELWLSPTLGGGRAAAEIVQLLASWATQQSPLRVSRIYVPDSDYSQAEPLIIELKRHYNGYQQVQSVWDVVYLQEPLGTVQAA
jgi:hypothetical protein